MLTQHLDIVFSLVWIIVLASILTTLIGLAISPYLARMPNLDHSVMIPIVLTICFVAAFATRGVEADVIVCAVFGLLGYVMDRYKYSRANLVIGMVLADMIERSLHLSLSLYGDYFIFTRPVTFAMFAFIVATTAWPFIRSWRKRRAAAHARIDGSAA